MPDPVNTVAPVASGTATVGITLSCSHGSWTNSPTLFQFQWQRETGVGTGIYTNISGAIASLYRLQTVDIGLRVRCVVTASNVALPPVGTGTKGVAHGFKILTRGTVERQFELNQAQAAGSQFARFDILNDAHWQGQAELTINDCITRGIAPLLVLHGTTGPISAATAQSFAQAQAIKWASKPVTLFEFCNEPDLNGWTPEQYAGALIGAYNGLKAGNASAKMIAGAIFQGGPGPQEWIRRMYAAGAKGHFDAFSMHLYDDPADNFDSMWHKAFSDSPNVRGIMDANGDQAIPLVSTESGGPFPKYSLAKQAQIVTNALTDGRPDFVCIYSMMNDEVHGFGMLNDDLTQRPSYTAFSAA